MKGMRFLELRFASYNTIHGTMGDVEETIKRHRKEHKAVWDKHWPDLTVEEFEVEPSKPNMLALFQGREVPQMLRTKYGATETGKLYELDKELW